MAKIILFTKQNYEGHSLVVESSESTLKGTGVNNDVSSVIVIDGAWTLYEHSDFKGTAWTVGDAGGPEDDGCYPSFEDWNGRNNTISSVGEVP